MNTKLNQIENWTELAQKANWSAASMAEQCGVSVRTLHRHFRETLGKNPKAWLTEQRWHAAVELLRDGSSIKEAAARLGYKQPHNFTRQYKAQWGICPSHQPLKKTMP